MRCKCDAIVLIDRVNMHNIHTEYTQQHVQPSHANVQSQNLKEEAACDSAEGRANSPCGFVVRPAAEAKEDCIAGSGSQLRRERTGLSQH
jgi:hypothetical protein